MFFDLVRKNSKRSRKENGLFFVSLIVSIIAFYIILSLENQDVIIFLKTIESDAVNRLFLLIPVLYLASLFILFFLVYFAGKYQLERRSHEFGMYQILGMQRKKLFFMFVLEEIWSSTISLSFGIPIAIFISEMISLITSKLVGLGIIGHNFTFSIKAVLFTIVGYVSIRLVALLLLSRTFTKKEIIDLLSESQDKKHRIANKFFTIIKLIVGIILLSIAYGMAIIGISWSTITMMGVTVIIGLCGTFLVFNGIGILFEMILRNRGNKNGLNIFTFRQLQENVFLKSNSLAVSSILVLLAICCFSYGVSVSLSSSKNNNNIIDYTFNGEEKEIIKELKDKELANYIDMNSLFDVKVGNFNEMENTFSGRGFIEAVENYHDSETKNILLNNLQSFEYPDLISLSGYNNILKLSGKDIIHLENNQIALYNDPDFSFNNSSEVVKEILKGKQFVEINKERYELIEEFYQDNIVTDRSININYGLIVTDELFDSIQGDKYSSYWNAKLKEDFVEENGLMQGISEVNELLNKTRIEYESYLQNMGRQLFYTVAASYTTIYLAIIFLIIANTVMGVQFLMQQQKNGSRYKTLVRLGCTYKDLCKSARKQIKWFFTLPVLVAVIGSIFGVRSLFSGIATTAMKSKVDILMIMAIPMIFVLFIVELIYIVSVMRLSDKGIHGLMEIRRDNN